MAGLVGVGQGAQGLVVKRSSPELATVLNQGRGVQITKNAGDNITYKPTVRNMTSAVVKADVWAQLGNQANVTWQPLEGSQSLMTVDLPPGDTVLAMGAFIPAGAVAAGQSYTYDCRIEIRPPGRPSSERVDYWDNYDEVRVVGPATVQDLTIVGMAYA